MERTRSVTILVGLSLLLLGANGILFFELWSTKQRVAAAVRTAAQAFEGVQAQTASSSLTFHVTVDDTFSLPINTSIPIDTSVSVPIVLPIIGQAANVTIPIRTSVPIRTTVQLPVKTSVPITISAKDIPLTAQMQLVRDVLLQLADDL